MPNPLLSPAQNRLADAVETALNEFVKSKDPDVTEAFTVIGAYFTTLLGMIEPQERATAFWGFFEVAKDVLRGKGILV